MNVKYGWKPTGCKLGESGASELSAALANNISLTDLELRSECFYSITLILCLQQSFQP